VKRSKVLVSALMLVLLLSALVPAGAASPALSGTTGTISPFLKVGPHATRASVAGPGYGIFTCQVGLEPDFNCYDPYQVRHAYGIDTLISAGFDGKGKTIVIIDAYQSPNIVQQLKTYDSFYNLPDLNLPGIVPDPNLGTFAQVAPDGLTPFDPNDGNMVGWAFEISLDVLWAHAIAPKANITLVLAKTNNDPDILSATKYAVDNNLGDVISQSFGENESCMDPALLAQQHQVFADATNKRITLFASSGDDGAAQLTCDGNSWVRAASSPASDPLVTAVGGTALHAADYTTKDPGAYQGEIVWNEADFGATGGGFSVLYDEPAYQKGTIHGGKQNGVPDVAYNAAVHYGVLTYLNIPGQPAGWYIFGGTSAGSPQWAAITAIADQKAGHNLGFINRALYTTGQSRPKYAGAFHDITSGNNSVVLPDADLNPVAVTGFNAALRWDAMTGLGSPQTAQLVDALIQRAAPGDGTAAIAGSKPHTHAMPSVPGHTNPH
jgi:subtilase family serine protease